MVEHVEEVIVRRPVAEVFDFVVTRNHENHPRWEDEVLEVRPLTQGPLRVGSRAVMVRKDFGKIRETTHECVALEHDRLATFRQLDGPMDFTITFGFSPVAEGTVVRVEVQAQPKGSMRLLIPVLRLRMPRVSARLSHRMRDVAEAEALSGVPPAQRPRDAAVAAR